MAGPPDTGEDRPMTDQRVLKPYHVEISLAVGRDEAWDALTQPAVLRQWFGWDYDGLDAEIQQIFVTEATLLAPERMGWADGSYLEATGDDETSTVRAVRLGDPPPQPDQFDAIEESWRAFLIQLTYLLGERPQGVRRTLHLTGETTGRQALTLADAGWHRVGNRVAWTAETAGQLVVVSGHDHLEHHYASAFQVTVSTFGMDDDAFGACRADWTRRWAPIADGARVVFTGTAAPR